MRLPPRTPHSALRVPHAAQWLEMDNQYRALAERQQWLDPEFAHIQPPTPLQQLEMIMAEFRSLVTRLTTRAARQPHLLSAANNLARTCLASSNAQSRLDYREHRMDLDERKWAEYMTDNFDKALEYCLRYTKPSRKIARQLRKAFTALKNMPGSSHETEN